MLSLTELVILVLVAILVYHLATVPRARRPVVRLIDSERPMRQAPKPPDDGSLEWMAWGGLAIAALACLAILIAATSGWV